ncbi:carboxypeptidase-like regulatory domain-containing protein [Aquimarina aquimarini]|uniref:carboxypeptidase-like regulatory domain-containing protein n=1 Tax=Aquimarina aquimarini TaxID=1191734 RepID=UPI000D56032D|nr:carboxypeptidase-like regulatory domain-containing protein [Aquimarina aquimarini]
MIIKKYLFSWMILALSLLGGFSFLSAQSKSSLHKIYGYVTADNIPIKNVNIFVKNKNRRTITDEKGYYYIEASERETIQFSFVGKKTVEIIVEDVTQLLNIKMTNDVNKLDEVLIKKEADKKQYSLAKKTELDKLNTAYGEIDMKSSAFSYWLVEGKHLNRGGVDLIEAIQGVIPTYGISNDGLGRKRVRVRPVMSEKNGFAIWDIDGVVYNYPPHIDINDIEHMVVLKGLGGTTNYGMRGAGGVIVVTTKSSIFLNTHKAEQKARGNQYKNDAFPYIDAVSTTIIDDFKKVNSSATDTGLYEAYRALLNKHKKQPSFYLDIATYFKKEKNNRKLSLEVLSDMEKEFHENAEALKALAYTYEELGEQSKALNVYNTIVYLRPSYAQSFRDLANSYFANREYQNAWDMYLRYLQRGFKLEEKGIEQMVYNEMKYLYTHKKDVAKIKETFEIKKEEEETLTSDIRVVFEWNTSEAEFLLEFVDPELNSFVYEHSQEKSKDRILDEKIKGYSSDEFFIYNLNKGEWLINIKYLGNKKNVPTYLKATVYRNWGRENQVKDVKLFKLNKYNHKMQLFTFNSLFR